VWRVANPAGDPGQAVDAIVTRLQVEGRELRAAS
jgi:hypothetical protein